MKIPKGAGEPPTDDFLALIKPGVEKAAYEIYQQRERDGIEGDDKSDYHQTERQVWRERTCYVVTNGIRLRRFFGRLRRRGRR